ncbi:cell division protein FtsX, partial [Candidatus Gracilibacteria bacterium]|nr:cell division protein FtsX [Candidatus Gracilibacteria bacterium]
GGMLLMINTFRIVLFSRREEIFVARLVGAERKFIALPFFVEGLILGFSSAVLGILAFVFVLRQVSVLPGGAIFLELWNHVFEWEVLCGGLVGVLGAWISVRKYLRGKFSQ